jgi:lipoate---protein ligase
MNAFFLQSRSGDPFYNLAVEELLLDHIPGDSLVLFIWQSHNAVVIGRNQNPWKETNRGFMRSNGITLARRVSGGGAVYHDRGNLNFSFIADKSLVNVERQLRAVCKSLAPYGISAEVGDRKDLRVLGKKFSGSAFAFRRGRALHHGTLLVNANLSMMRALEGGICTSNHRGTLSEKSEVLNLCEINPEISVEGVAVSLRAGMEELLGIKPPEAEIDGICDATPLAALIDKHRSWEWRYGNTPAFEVEVGAGDERVLMHVEKGRIGPVIFLPGE